MGWKDNLKNISKPTIDVSDYTSGENITEQLIQTNKTNAGSFWLNFTSIALFVLSLYSFSTKNGFMQALLMSSYIAFVVSFAFIISKWSYSIYPFFLFGLLWTVSVVAIYNGKTARII